MQPMASSVWIVRVSNRGVTTLPAALRHRWGIDDGGEVAFLDLGDTAVVFPGGIDAAEAELHHALVRDGGYERGLAMIYDPDLADQ